jgi:Zn-dependent peptidase ImmA (M78 family)/transcriptional regulator with XRE-family HTH domain
MPTISDRVRELLARSGMSQREFAERIGLDNSKLSKSLSGTRRFSSLDLARIAEVGQVTVDWLLSGDEPVLALAARVSGDAGSATAIAEAKRLSAFREDVAFLGYQQPWRPVRRPVERGLDTARGKRLAVAALERIAEAGVDLADLPAAVEVAFGADVAVGDLGLGFDGLSVITPEIKLILVARGVIPWRQRFTIAHELGHLLAGDDQGLHLDQDVLDRAHQGQPTERRANAFAAEFLMPEARLRAAAGSSGLTREGFAELVCSLRVSPSALAYRLLNFRLIDSMTCDRFKVMSAQQAAELAGRLEQLAADVATANQVRPPGLLTRDTYAAYAAGQATLRPYANVINADVDALMDAFETDAGDDPS